ncbi:hypothetical protein SD457_22235 [Coprobacillaceae bacterium CR2/5/TPMF4]|nr:hypothetical protein SD457_22235 [Coprobacillaceae bacterium CR2/5/TPMF4]
MISALKIYVDIDVQDLTPKFIFQFNNMLKEVFNGINNSSITFDIIQKFNNKISSSEYIELKKLFKKVLLKYLFSMNKKRRLNK